MSESHLPFMRLVIFSSLFLCSLTALGQKNTLTFTNYGQPIPFGRDTFYSNKIHEITLNPDLTYDFWSRPYISCHTWRHHKGTWKKAKDTLIFLDNYEVIERDTRTTYNNDCSSFFSINFKTDKNDVLKNREIKVQFFYDFHSHLEDSVRELTFNLNNTLQIPYSDIPNFSQLASIRIEYLLNGTEKRYDFLTENNTVNVKKGDIPNIIVVEFVEAPKKEVVYRTIKGIIQKGTLVIISATKTKINLPDYYPEIEFEDKYELRK